MAKQTNEEKLKNKKFICGNLFTNADVRVEPEEVQVQVIKGYVSAQKKLEFKPNAFFSRASAVIRGQIGNIFKSCLIFVLFLVPFFLAIFYLSSLLDKSAVGKYNFMSDIGIGYGGEGHNMAKEWLQYTLKSRLPLISMLVIGMMIASIAVPGLYYVAKRVYFQDTFTKKIQTFFLGVKKYWWQFILTFSLIGIMVAAMMLITMYIDAARVPSSGHNISAGWYVLGVVIYLIGTLTIMFSLILLPLYVSYNLKYGQAIKNTFVIIFNSPIAVVLTFLITSLPMVLGSINKIVFGIVLAIMGIIGFVIECVFWTALIHRSMCKCNMLDTLAVRKVQTVQRAVNYASQPKKKKKTKVQFVSPHKNRKNK